MHNQVNQIPNRLINEKSPYLLQHAYNPVDWYPWGDEAFAKAKVEDKPVFLSIGYSTCHWCHVMERESFETQEAADLLNRSFIAIKVDKEERPDIDAVYMNVCQTLTGSGGWPLTILMTPGQKPFYGGTYFPLHSHYGRIGLAELLEAVSAQWKEKRTELLESSEKIYQHLQSQSEEKPSFTELTKEFPQKGYYQLKQSFDPIYGGFGQAPKFPASHNLLFLLKYGVLEQEQMAISMAETTLIQMYRGGIYDHIGNGFSRYSTDDQWLVPHFEKMLYDNALLLYAYTEAFQYTHNELFQSIAERIIEYVLKELTDPEGGFYCGQDADSDGEEGKYYVFTRQEIIDVLGDAKGNEFCEWFHITEAGNFEGKNIPNLLSNDHFANLNPDIEKAQQKLYEYRLIRTKLHRDDKVLTSWNGMMLAALAKAANVLEKPEILESAKKAQQFLEKNLSRGSDGLFIRWRKGDAAHEGQLDDYAFYTWSLLEMYQAEFEVKYLERAIQLTDRMISSFWDKENGGFYLYDKEAEQLITRPKETYDGAVPSGNSVAALVLIRLWKLTGDIKWMEYKDKQLSYLASVIKEYPAAHSFSLFAVMEELYSSTEIICVTDHEPDYKQIKEYLNQHPKANATVLLKTKGNEAILGQVAPYTQNYPIPAEGMAVYVCENGTCKKIEKIGT